MISPSELKNCTFLKCPHCGVAMPVSTYNHTKWFANPYRAYRLNHSEEINDSDRLLVSHFIECPACEKITVLVHMNDDDTLIPVNPKSFAKYYPEYIPKQIRQDYEEACAIIHLSPKASAILARRCIESIIKDFWNIDRFKLSKALEDIKPKIPNDLFAALKSATDIGNAGAHFKIDSYGIPINITLSEADNLLQLIELLFDEWYISRYNRSQLFESINNSAKAIK